MFILILGGIASGKTTLRLLLRNLLRYRGRRVLSFSLPPFSYLTYILLKLIVHLVAVPPHLRYIYEHPIATLEKDRPALLGRMIKFITLFDMFQATSIVLLTSIISNIGVDILVEDSTLILDHFLYLRLYHESSNITGSGDI
ncbi:MAG: hypothetical protein QXF26_09595, partial [Candidatus Bathyarchaeia archaeon]